MTANGARGYNRDTLTRALQRYQKIEAFVYHVLAIYNKKGDPMRYSAIIACVGVLLTNSPPVFAAPAIEDVDLFTGDAVHIFGKHYHTEHPRAVILAFHQAGSNMGEYNTIAPRLVKAGFDVVTFDLRSGGKMFGQSNKTVDTAGKSTNYEPALYDMTTVVSYSHISRAPIVVMGSSYSAGLAFPLTVMRRNEIAAVVAFSPGEYFEDKEYIHKSATEVFQPVFVTSSTDKQEIDAAASILDATTSKVKVQFIPKSAGVHGASTLIKDRNKKGAEDNWKALLAFLNENFPAKKN